MVRGSINGTLHKTLSGKNHVNPTFNSTGSAMVRDGSAHFVTGTNTPLDGPNAREISNVVSSGPQAEAHVRTRQAPH